jgi:hypothetical protein
VWQSTFGLIVDELGRSAMRIQSSVTSLSWIPQGAVEGYNRLPFGLRVAHFDPPPPEVLGDLDELQADDRFRFANRLEAWIEVQDGRIVDAGQGGGGRINVTKVATGRPASRSPRSPCPTCGPTQRSAPLGRGLSRPRAVRPASHPRRVRHEPYLQVGGPVTWSTLALTIHSDGTVEPERGLSGIAPYHTQAFSPLPWPLGTEALSLAMEVSVLEAKCLGALRPPTSRQRLS